MTSLPWQQSPPPTRRVSIIGINRSRRSIGTHVIDNSILSEFGWMGCVRWSESIGVYVLQLSFTGGRGGIGLISPLPTSMQQSFTSCDARTPPPSMVRLRFLLYLAHIDGLHVIRILIGQRKHWTFNVDLTVPVNFYIHRLIKF